MNYNKWDTDWEKLKIGLGKYMRIMNQVHRIDVSNDKEFQRQFNGFYRMRQRPKLFYETFYQYLQENKAKEIGFSETLNYFYIQMGRLEPSFSSKLVATVNPKLPVWDSEVLDSLNLKTPGYHLAKDIRKERLISIYGEIEKWYERFIISDKGKQMLKIFNQEVGPVEITDVKKIDLILWQTRK